MSQFRKRDKTRQEGETIALKSEPISQYFAPHNSYKSVTRGEFGSIISKYTEAQMRRVWWRRLVAWINRRGRRLPPTVFDYFVFLRAEEQLAQAIHAGVKERDERLATERAQRTAGKAIDASGKVIERVGDLASGEVAT